jgi:hypothetical protein
LPIILNTGPSSYVDEKSGYFGMGLFIIVVPRASGEGVF